MTLAKAEERLGTKSLLPQGWRWVRLGDICDMNPSRPAGFRRASDAPTTFVPMSSVDEHRGTILSAEIRPFSEVVKGYTFFSEGDILFAKITPCMQNGKQAIARGLIDGIGFGSTEFHVIRPRPGVVCEWIHRFVRQPQVLSAAVNHFTGAVGQQRVPESFLASLEIPLPSIDEQKRIMHIVNEQMVAVEKARAAAETRLEAAKALPAAYLRAVFSSEQARDWPKKRIVEICTVRGGKRLPKGTDFAHTKTKFPYIRVVDFEKGNINLHGLKYLEEGTRSQISRYIINRNDVYLSIAGTIGIAGIIPDALDGANLTENAARLIIMDKSNLFRDYLARFLQSRAGQDSIKQRTNAVGQPKLALERIETIEIPVPLISRQRELAHELDNQLSEANYLIKTLEQELETINALPAALLRRAFTGGL